MWCVFMGEVLQIQEGSVRCFSRMCGIVPKCFDFFLFFSLFPPPSSWLVVCNGSPCVSGVDIGTFIAPHHMLQLLHFS